MKKMLRAPNLFLFLFLFAAVFWRVFTADISYPASDALRYISMGLNLHDFGVLTGAPYVPGQVPAPGLGVGGPWIAAELALAAWLDAGTLETFRCVLASPAAGACVIDLGGLRVLHGIEIFLFLVSVWMVAGTIFKDQVRPWLAVLAAYACGETFVYAGLALTEPGYLMVLGVFLALWMGVVCGGRVNALSCGWMGFVLGVLVLVKPVTLAMVPIMVLVMAFLVVRKHLHATAGLACALGFAVVMGVWSVRTGLALGTFGFSDPAYFEAAFAHRVAYNRMGWDEWLAGWLYYLPDFGDNLARDLFGRETVAALGWDPVSHYVYGRDVLDHQAQTAAVSAKSYLLDGFVWPDPVKHIAVSALLLWRGIFVGDLWGLAALVLLVPTLWRGAPSLRLGLLVLGILPLAVAGAAALVSVSIPRYNLALIPFYAIILAWALDLGWKVLRKIRN